MQPEPDRVAAPRFLPITEEEIESFCEVEGVVRPDPSDERAVNSFASRLGPWVRECRASEDKDGHTPTSAAPRRYSAFVYCEEPETRWFHRHVLRRRWRRTLMHAGQLSSFTIDRSRNGIYNSVVVFRDPMEDLRV